MKYTHLLSETLQLFVGIPEARLGRPETLANKIGCKGKSGRFRWILLLATAGLLAGAGCRGHSLRVQVTGVTAQPGDRYEIDVVEVYDSALLTQFKEIKNDEWFRARRAQYLAVTADKKVFEIHPSIIPSGKPFKVKIPSGAKGVLIFSRGNRNVREATLPEIVVPKKRFFGMAGGNGEINVVKGN